MTILLFGLTRDIVGNSSIEVPREKATSILTVDKLKQFVFGQFPELKKITSIAVAVNNEYATDGTPIGESDEIALIPPVSGG